MCEAVNGEPLMTTEERKQKKIKGDKGRENKARIKMRFKHEGQQVCVCGNKQKQVITRKRVSYG